jgi:cellulose synthase (UDP-forming)
VEVPVSIATLEPGGSAPAGETRAAAGSDPRLGPIHWPVPDQATARRRALLLAPICLALAAWYLSWLLQARRVGDPALFGLLVAAEAFNLAQAAGFWWTCARQRVRRGRAPRDPGLEVDVLIPVYDEPLAVVEPTVAAASALRGANANVWLLDDGHRADLAKLAGRYGSGYLRRRDRSGAKAGNLNHALARTGAPYVAVLDSDHVPRKGFLARTLGHLEDARVAFVQTPQYYANAPSGPIPAAAAAQQALFFGPIARGKDGLGTMFCCGTNVVFRREALEQTGGFPERSLTEDFELSVHLHQRGWKSVYVSEVAACGLGPEDMTSYVSQQRRWARGCLGAIATILRARLPARTKLQYLLSAGYFLPGWTLLLYMLLPILRLLFGLQPLAQVSADQFLIHFAPYWCSALGAVAVAGTGTYTFAAFALSACNFWIHLQSTLSALGHRTQRFVVTRKRGSSARQPRAVAPALVAIPALAGASVFALGRGAGPATLNNVAFAALHSSVLLIGALPALRTGSSPTLAPEPRSPARTRRRWPRPLFAGALCVVLTVPVGLGLLGARELRAPLDAGQRARAAADAFLRRYVAADGRVIRRDQGGDTGSEGQSYAMLLALALGDRREFDRVWRFTQKQLQLPDGLLASRWAAGRIASPQPASDADLDAADALVLAGERFGSGSYRRAGTAIARAVLAQETVRIGATTVLAAGPWARSNPAVINPSYFSPRDYADLYHADPDPRWRELAASSRRIAAALIDRGRGGALAPDWAALATSTPLDPRPVGNPGTPAAGSPSAISSFDAFRVAVRFASSCVPSDRRLAAHEWPLYRRAPGRDAYALSGVPQTRMTHPTSLVAAAAAAAAAGAPARAARLLGAGQAIDSEHPTYYGAAWVALGRMMLTTSALGTC